MTSEYLQTRIRKIDEKVQELKVLVTQADAEHSPDVAYYTGFLFGVLHRFEISLKLSLATAKELTPPGQSYANPVCPHELVQ